jgi:hypothetical protein
LDTNYGQPAENSIRDFAEELAQFLNEGYLKTYEFGYQKNGKRLLSWFYRVDENGIISTDDRAGKVVPYVSIAGATFFNHLTPNERYHALSNSQRAAFKSTVPVSRMDGNGPNDGSGYWTSDRNYFSWGCGLNRQTFQPAS